jgi:hypothetical protein
MRVFLPALALSALSLSGSAQTPPPASSGAAATPAAGMSTYHNDALHLSYIYPATYKDASSTVAPAFEATIGQNNVGGKDALRCVTLPFSAMNSAAGQFSLVLLVRADGGCMKKSFTAAQLPEFTRGEVQGLTASGAHTQFGEAVSFTTQGHPAQMIRGTFELPTGQQLHAMVVCVLLKPDAACWQFLASSEQGLTTMGAFPVSLDGAPPSPLLPATLTTKP